jgi:hypothetical protein
MALQKKEFLKFLNLRQVWKSKFPPEALVLKWKIEVFIFWRYIYFLSYNKIHLSHDIYIGWKVKIGWVSRLNWTGIRMGRTGNGERIEKNR